MTNCLKFVGVATLLALTLSGCGGSQASPSTNVSPRAADESIHVNEAARNLLPSEVKSDGTLTVALDPSNAPWEFYDKDNKTIIGFDADIARQISATLGLKLQMVPTTFDSLLPSLQAGKFPVAISDVTIKPEREKVVDFIEYKAAGTGLGVPRGNPLHLKMEPLSLCGVRVGAQTGTVQALSAVPEIDAACTAQGKKHVDLKLFKTQDQANLALTSGRVDAIIANLVTISYQASLSNGEYELAPGDLYQAASQGIVTAKASPLRPALSAALKSIVEDGHYDKLLTKWSLAPATKPASMQ